MRSRATSASAPSRAWSTRSAGAAASCVQQLADLVRVARLIPCRCAHHLAPNPTFAIDNERARQPLRLIRTLNLPRWIVQHRERQAVPVDEVGDDGREFVGTFAA